MKHLLLTGAWLCLAVAGLAAGELPADRYAALIDNRADRLVQRVVVPSAEQPQGEVRLLRRGDLLVVQTVLASRVLKQVVAAIDGKEERNWPEPREGHRDSRKYRDELFRATGQAWEIFRHRQDPEEKRQFLVIEFICGTDRSLIALYAPGLAGDYGSLERADRQLLNAWRTAGHYMQGNIIEIVRDSFDLDRAAAETLLRPLWPAQTGTQGKRP